MTRIAVCIVVVLAFAWACVEFGKDLKQGEIDAKALAESNARKELVTATAEKLAAMAANQAAVTERVIREVKTNTIYRDCVLPDSGVRLLNDAISGNKPTGDSGVQTTAQTP